MQPVTVRQKPRVGDRRRESDGGGAESGVRVRVRGRPRPENGEGRGRSGPRPRPYLPVAVVALVVSSPSALRARACWRARVAWPYIPRHRARGGGALDVSSEPGGVTRTAPPGGRGQRSGCARINMARFPGRGDGRRRSYREDKARSRGRASLPSARPSSSRRRRRRRFIHLERLS
jgi:hypothetical protein